MISKPNPGYYAITPASVRYCQKLCANAKLLYGELTALSNKQKYCWAKNSYFAKLYGVENNTISEWLRQLRINGFINIEIDQKRGNARKIFIIESIQDKPNTSSEKPEEGHPKIRNTYSEKTDLLYNNTSNTTMNNTGNTTRENVVKFEKLHNKKAPSLGEHQLRPNEQEFSIFCYQVEELIKKENTGRPHNPFKWLPKKGSLNADLHMLVYQNLRGCHSIEDTIKLKISLLSELSNRNGNLNWLNYLLWCIKYTILTSRKKAITDPFAFTYSLLYKPGIIIGALTDGILSKEVNV